MLNLQILEKYKLITGKNRIDFAGTCRNLELFVLLVLEILHFKMWQELLGHPVLLGGAKYQFCCFATNLGVVKKWEPIEVLLVAQDEFHSTNYRHQNGIHLACMSIGWPLQV